MSSPTLEYYWLKTLSDGVTVIPQFDFVTGESTRWNANSDELLQVSLVPFTVDLAEKVIRKGTPAIATTNPTFIFRLKPGETAEAGLTGDLTIFDYYKCDICGNEFKHVDGTKYAECPKCGTRDEWYCARCDQYKLEHRVTSKGQVQCLDCDIEMGLNRVVHLKRKTSTTHTCDYFIRTATRTLTVKDNGSVIYE